MRFFRTKDKMRILTDSDGVTRVFSVDLVNEWHVVAQSNRPNQSNYSKEDIHRLVISQD